MNDHLTPEQREIVEELQREITAWAEANILGAQPVSFDQYAEFCARWFGVPVEWVIAVYGNVDDPNPNSLHCTILRPRSIEQVYFTVTVE